MPLSKDLKRWSQFATTSKIDLFPVPSNTINLASRITNQAAPGTFWCPHEYVRALSDPPAFTFESKGKHSFKNISEEKEVFELITDHLKLLLLTRFAG
ncbi:MAG TPA: hypothetical protein VI548_14650 [Chitinophagaceae bacterium]|nr:hypothetical protein [Chitinophagaceae bacterium]